MTTARSTHRASLRQVENNTFSNKGMPRIELRQRGEEAITLNAFRGL